MKNILNTAMRFKNSNLYLIIVIISILFISVYLFVSNIKTPESSVIENNSATLADTYQKQIKEINTAALYAQVVPPEGVTFPFTWKNIGPRLIASGVIDLEKFRSLYESSGRPLTEEQITFFTEGSNETIYMTPENGHFILNTLWALGIANKNDLLSEGLMGQYAENGKAGNLASTGGWNLGTKPGGELLNSAEIIKLTPKQQAIVERAASNSYRPCCNNPTSFPDCNHGAAALGLAELLASQGATEKQIMEAVKAANSIWFSRQYLELAVYFKVTEGKDWKDVDPQVIVSQKYSSSSGWGIMHKKLKEMGMLQKASSNGSSCSV
ncbi:MAG: hypothetical protein KKA10_02255 [Euryarchaeota archaeon]|nr:hypothetical protein [Euryarchaeota archaeon]MCG2737108.1 hypothetical protein [Candidatus Methanoperedenaceae archaeon]